jgi:tRNA dimethylallyltransferase
MRSRRRSSSGASCAADVRPRVVAIVGPTGVGKTEVACEIARRSGAEIVNADSMQVYRGMDIGTAKPAAALRAEIPHHLIDVVEPDDPMSAGRYAELARAATAAIHARGRPVLLCGGTGLYARAFAGGLVDAGGADAELRAELRRRPLEELRAELERRDPESARAIGPRDRVRLERALEAQRHTGAPTSAVRAAHRFSDRPYDVSWIGLDLPREVLWARIEARVAAMLAAGWVDEVRGLRTRYAADVRPLRAIGYREVGAFLEGALDADAMRAQIVVATRRYAKRQRTWFRAEPGLRWIDAAAAERAVEVGLGLLAGGE